MRKIVQHTPQSERSEAHASPESYKPGKSIPFSKKILRFLGVFLKWTLIVLLFLSVSLMIAINMPKTQTWLAQEASSYLSKQLGYNIYVEKVKINLINQDIALRELLIYDTRRQSMIQLEELKADVDLLLNAVDATDIIVNQAHLKKGQINLVVNPISGKLNIEEFIDAIDKLTAPKEPKKPEKKTKKTLFLLKEAFLEEVSFSYHDPRADSLNQGFDYGHFRFDHLNGYIQQLNFVADTIAFETYELRGIDKASGLEIKELKTKFLMNKKSMQFNALYAEINNSILQDSLVFNVESMKDFGDFNHKVNIEARMDSNSIYTKDLALFAPALSELDDHFIVKGYFKGTIDKFFLSDADISFGKGSHLAGNYILQGLPDLQKTSMSFEVKPSLVLVEDLSPYLGSMEWFDYLERLGNIGVQGRFDGFMSDFQTQAELTSLLGDLRVNLQLNTTTPVPVYKADFQTESFDIGTLLDQSSTLQKASLTATVNGQGFTLSELNTQIKAEINTLEILGYPYQSIQVDGSIQKQLFEGSLKINDPNAQITTDGIINLNPPAPLEPYGQTDLKTAISKLDLQQLGFTSQASSISGYIITQTKGFRPDELVGFIEATNLDIIYGNRSLPVDSAVLLSNKNEYGFRDLNIYSDYLSLEATGIFNIDQLSLTVTNLAKEFQLALTNETAIQKEYYSKKTKNTYAPFQLSYSFTFNDINPFIQLFDSITYVSIGASFNGELSGGDSTHFTLHSTREIQRIVYGQYEVLGANIHFETYKSAYDADILAEWQVGSRRQNWSSGLATEDFTLQAIWLDGILDFKTHIQQAASSNQAIIEGHVNFEPTATIIEIDQSAINILDENWYFIPGRQIKIYNDSTSSIEFKEFVLKNHDQTIGVNGTYNGRADSEPLKVLVENFNLNNLDSLAGKDLGGVLNINAQWQNEQGRMTLLSNTTLTDLTIEGLYVGNLSGMAQWDNTDQVVKIGLDIHNKKDYIFFLNGTYAPGTDKLNVTAKLKNVEINILEPFLKENISQMQGLLTGQIRAKGSLSSPDLSGYIDAQQTRFRVNYMGAIFGIDDRIYLSKSEIKFKRTKITDINNHVGVIEGSIYHYNFKDFYISVRGDLDNFTLMDTKEGENGLYYGRAVISGNVMVDGSFNDLYIKSDVTTERGTRLFIPLDTYQSISDKSYIQYVNFSEVQQAIEKNVPKINLSGIQMDLNLNVTDEAEFEIIFDKSANELIRGRGKGLIQMNIDTRGVFNMYGDFYITDGIYNFSLFNTIKKQFKIRPNSVIYFVGDLYSAELNLTASYDVRTSLAALNVNSDSDVTPPSLRQLYPVSVLIKLDHTLLAPRIALDIDLKDLEYRVIDAEAQRAFLNLKAAISANEREINRQAFFLITSGRFAPLGNGQNGAFASSSAGTRTVSEFFSSQLSNWLSQVDENLKIDVDLSGINDNNQFVTLSFSYTLLNGRLRIARDGVFSNNQVVNNANIIGDWTVEYILTKEGNLRLKMYNRTNPAQINNATTVSNTTATTTGFSISHTKNFNSIWDLFRKKKKENPSSKVPKRSQEANLPKQEIQEP